MAYLGGIEAGGTKFVCGVCTEDGTVVHRWSLPTGDPADTLAQVAEYFRQKDAELHLAGIGLASFGPVDLHPDSATYGYITTTPKPGWGHFNIKGTLEEHLGREVAFDTDVNAAALGEGLWGAAVGKENVIYITVGTGIGGGILVGGQLVHGLLHSEMGHVRIRTGDDFPGICPFHEYCLEGLASGPAIAARWGKPGSELPPEHPAWKLEARLLAEGVAGVILTLSPEIVVLGGGVMEQAQLFPMIREEVKTLLNGYIHQPEILDHIDTYIVPPKLGKNAGLAGAAALAASKLA